MKRHTARLFVLGTQVILVAAIVCIIISIIGKNWFENAENTFLSTRVHFGLTTLCRSEVCIDRDSVLSFEELGWPMLPLLSKDFDVILLTLVISIVFMVIGLLISLMLCCTVNGRKKWRIICSLVTLMVLVAVIANLSGIAYFEGKIADKRISATYKHGWTSIVAWLGFGLLIVDTVLLVVVSCVKPDDHSRKPHSVKSTASYVSSDNETLPSSRNNKGFEGREDGNNAYYVGKNQKRDTKPSIPLSSYERAKAYRPSAHEEPDYGSPRGSSNLVYQADYRSNEHVGGDRRNELVYDPRKRTAGNSRRKRSFELAYDSREPPSASKRHTYSSGYPNTSEYSPRRETYSTEQNTSSQPNTTENDWTGQMNTSGFDPRHTYSSPYYEEVGKYKPSRKTHRPNIDSEGYRIR